MRGDGEGLGRGSSFGQPRRLGGLWNQLGTIRPDNRKGAHAITQLRGDMTAEDAAERTAGDVKTALASKHDVEPLDDDAGQPLRGMRLGRCSGLPETRQVRCCNGETP